MTALKPDETLTRIRTPVPSCGDGRSVTRNRAGVGDCDCGDAVATPSNGGEGGGEFAMMRAPLATANAVVDVLARRGIRHMKIPIRPDRLSGVLREKEMARSRGRQRLGR